MITDVFPTKPSGRRTPAALLEAAEQARAKAAQRLARATAKVEKRKATDATRERKLDTRRKIMAGAIALAHCRHDPAFKAILWGQLDDQIVKDEERLLFGLSALPPETVAARLAELTERGQKRARKSKASG